MVNFELVDPAQVTSAPDTNATFEQWARSVAEIESKRAGRPIPEISFRYSKAHKARTIRRQISIAYGRQLLHGGFADRIEVEPGDNPCEEPAFTTESYYLVTHRPARPARKSSSGVTYWYKWGSRISVTLGTDDHDRRMVFLHEVAHSTAQEREHHPPSFFRRAFDLYRRYGLDMARCAKAETDYKPRNARGAARPYKEEGARRIGS